MDRLIQDALSIVKVSKNHVVDFVVEQEALFIKADQSKLRQVIQNLMSNAVKYSRPDSTVLIEGESALREGSMPAKQLKTVLIALRPAAISAEELGAKLRRHEPPIIARIEPDQVLLDLRTVFDDEEAHILHAIQSES
jgi:L-seryl-tRNA(Ser) seleniumtransferase